MGLFERFPYTNFHELNAGWMLQMMKDLEAAWEQFTAGNSLSFADPLTYDATKSYAKNTIVLDANGNAYISLKAVAAGIGLSNTEYWLMVFDYEAFMEKVNKNFTGRYYRDENRAKTAMVIGDWLTLDDVLCKATAAIAVDDLLEVGVNIEHFTLEDFIKAFMTSANQMIQQYKNAIDASELAFTTQINQTITDLTANLQAQLDAVIAGVTVDSEVIDARIGYDNLPHATLGNAIRSQIGDLYDGTFNQINSSFTVADFRDGNFNSSTGESSTTGGWKRTNVEFEVPDDTLRLVMTPATGLRALISVFTERPAFANGADNSAIYVESATGSADKAVEVDYNPDYYYVFSTNDANATISALSIPTIVAYQSIPINNEARIDDLEDGVFSNVNVDQAVTDYISGNFNSSTGQSSTVGTWHRMSKPLTIPDDTIKVIATPVTGHRAMISVFTAIPDLTDGADNSAIYVGCSIGAADEVVEYTYNNLYYYYVCTNISGTMTESDLPAIQLFVALPIYNKYCIDSLEENPVPSYYQSYIETKANDINALVKTLSGNADDIQQFIFLTDYHYDNLDPLLRSCNTKHCVALIDYLLKHTGAGFISFGGDVLVNFVTTQPEMYSILADFNDYFAPVREKMLSVLGNHEFNCNDTPTHAQLSIMLNKFIDNVNHDIDDYGDYYIDQPSKKIRYYYLSCKSALSDYELISNAQIKWFMKSLETVPEGYTVIGFTHLLLYWHADLINEEITFNTTMADGTPKKDAVALENIVNAFVTRSTVTFDGVTADYSSINADFAAILSGHWHYDGAYITSEGVPFTVTTADSCRRRNRIYNWASATSPEINTSLWNAKNDVINECPLVGTDREQAFDVVTLNKNSHSLYMTRVGDNYNSKDQARASETRSFTYPSTIV